MPDNSALLMAAPQIKVGPALSATSDMPDVNLAAQPTPETKPAEETKPAVETEAKVVETKTEETKPEGEKPEGENADQTPAWMKAEVTKERNRRREAESRAQAAEAKANQATANLTKALEGIKSLTDAQAAQISKDADAKDPRPNREAFDTPDAYDTALVDWAGRRAALVARAEAAKVAEETTQAERTKQQQADLDKQNREVIAAFETRKAKFIEDHPDYAELVDGDDNLPISIPMAHAILTDEDGPAIAYYLGQNPDEAARISKLPPVKAVSELGRIAARLATKPAVSTKPAPIKPLKTGSEAANRKTPDEETMEEYGARRNRERMAAQRERMGLPN